jgi:hypothetical protein
MPISRTATSVACLHNSLLGEVFDLRRMGKGPVTLQLVFTTYLSMDKVCATWVFLAGIAASGDAGPSSRSVSFGGALHGRLLGKENQGQILQPL